MDDLPPRYLLDVQPGLFQTLTLTTGADITRHVHGPTGVLWQTDPQGSLGHLLPDGLGSIRTVTDAGGTPLDTRRYHPYGEPASTTGTPQTPFGFTGEMTDTNGLLFLRARYYNPGLGVFPSLDVLEDYDHVSGSLNRYMHTYGNPVNLVDLDGLQPHDPNIKQLRGGGGGGGGGGGIVTTTTTTTKGPRWQDYQLPPWHPSGTGINPVPPTLSPSTAAAPVTAVGATLLYLSSLLQGTVTSPQPSTKAQTTSCPVTPQTRDSSLDGSQKVIVELGAGDYTGAMMMKTMNPSARIIATNSHTDWTEGKHVHEIIQRNEQMGIGVHPDTYKHFAYHISVYIGWKMAKTLGIEVGTDGTIENNQVNPDYIGDLVYTVMPYPNLVNQFGVDAARIAKLDKNTTVAITQGSAQKGSDFVKGFRSKRSFATFVEVVGFSYGGTGEAGGDGRPWESGPYSTLIHVVP